MATLLSHPQDVQPPSPALTNPDMILPYIPRFKDAEISSRKMEPGSMSTEFTPTQSTRPTLPGSWLSEEDMRLAHLEDNCLRQPEMQIAKLKSPVGRFLDTLDPRMKAGIGIEVPEYSPSVYSPTDPEGRTPEGEDEPLPTPFTSAPHGDTKSGYEDDEDDDIMGARAEEILANAKQRLLAMESNLNRARTLSLGTTNSEIISSPESRSIPFRAGKSSNSNTNHVRFGSDPRTPNGKPVYDPTVRSASALGSPNPFGSFVHKHHHLEPLNEDDLLGSPTSDYDHPRTSMRDLQEQMNNLKGKINSLQQKSREDRMRRRSLQALKAPSPFTDAAVSTSSPYVEHMTSEGDSSGHSTGFLDKSSDAIKEFDPADSDKPRHQTSENDRKQKFLQDESQEDKAVFDQQKDSRSPAVITPTDQDLAPPILQPATSYRSESEEPEVIIPSSPTYETDFLNPNPPSIRKSSSPAHEDRPDAFDYETYVLNSTMGSYSRIGFRSRSNSISSVGSASTQRPTYKGDASHPETHPSTLLRSSHYRTNSSDSTSTTATFSTAITGRNDSRAESRASSRLQQQRQQPPTGASYYLSPRLLSRPSLPNLRQGMHQKLFISESQQKRDSFSPFPLPNKPASNFSTPLNSALPPHEARTQILAIILRSASSPLPITIPQPTEHPSPDDEIIRCWASEDESLVGAVLDGLVKVVGRVIRGEDEGGAGRSVLESIGAVLQR